MTRLRQTQHLTLTPDDKTFAYLKDRQFAPKGVAFDEAVEYWKTLRTDRDAKFDYDVTLDVTKIAPSITWGTSPEHTIAITGAVPSLESAANPVQAETWRAALEYMGLQPGMPMLGVPVDHVFIGSCTNSRLSDLQDAASVVRGRHVATGVTAWVVPGSEEVKRKAESLGLDKVFTDAGFEWRQPGCSMCVAANGETVASGARCISTSNRNFVGRQGPGARTHLASPAMAAAAAVTGVITDVRNFL